MDWCERVPEQDVEPWAPAPAAVTGDLPAEPDLVPYRAMDLQGWRRLMVVAPHPDDETFGCGGLIARAASQGVAVRVLVLSDGALYGEAAVREAECLRAARALGLGEAAVEFWRLPDRGLSAQTDLAARLHAACRQWVPEVVMAPSPWEVHPDHLAACRVTMQALADSRDAPLLGFYEVGQPLLPNRLVDITPVVRRKQEAIAAYASQLQQQRYDQQLLGLAAYRAYTLGPAATHAEAFWFPGREAQCELAKLQAQCQQQWARRWGSAGL